MPAAGVESAALGGDDREGVVEVVAPVLADRARARGRGGPAMVVYVNHDSRIYVKAWLAQGLLHCTGPRGGAVRAGTAS